jgi:hypothetical protein
MDAAGVFRSAIGLLDMGDPDRSSRGDNAPADANCAQRSI